MINSKLTHEIISNQDGKRFDIDGDFNIFFRCIQDMILNGGNLIPSGTWSQFTIPESLNTDDLRNEILAFFNNSLPTMRKMMDPWTGIVGMQPLSEEQVEIYKTLLARIDKCGLMGEDLFYTAKKQDMINSDLGSIMDVNLLYALTPINSNKKYSILEVGGGYGRLAEAITNALNNNSFHYVLVDAVPSSLLYAKQYLEAAFPDKKIGFYLNDSYNDSYDFYITPPWHLNKITNTLFDICVNIESMQEMELPHVNYYLDAFDKLSKDGATIYISNSRNYYFKESWNFPDYWHILMLCNTPRSWTKDHPTIMFRKDSANNYKLHNDIMEGMHASNSQSKSNYLG